MSKYVNELYQIATVIILATGDVYPHLILSFIVGVTNIDTFLLSLFTGKYQILYLTLIKAVLIATLSNNLMKLFYVLALGNPKIRKPVLWEFG